MIFQEGSFTIMDLTKAVKEKYKKPLASCTNEEIYICLLEQVKKLAKEMKPLLKAPGKFRQKQLLLRKTLLPQKQSHPPESVSSTISPPSS